MRALSRLDHKCSLVAPLLELCGVHADDAAGQGFPDPTSIFEQEPPWPKTSISKIDLGFIREIKAFEKSMCTLPSMDFRVKGIEQASVIFSEKASYATMDAGSSVCLGRSCTASLLLDWSG